MMATPRAFRARIRVEQAQRLVFGQRGGRLVENEQPGVLGQGARDDDELLRGKVERGHRRRRVDVEAEIRERLAGARAGARATSIMPQRVGSSLSEMFSATVRSGTTLTSCGTSATPAASASATSAGR